MNKAADFNYKSVSGSGSLSYQAIELHYGDSRNCTFKGIVVIPTGLTTIYNIIEKLETETNDILFSGFGMFLFSCARSASFFFAHSTSLLLSDSLHVFLSLPKFTAEFGPVEISENLKSLGLTEPFTNGNHFNRISESML
jgi:hypothetical protein